MASINESTTIKVLFGFSIFPFFFFSIKMRKRTPFICYFNIWCRQVRGGGGLPFCNSYSLCCIADGLWAQTSSLLFIDVYVYVKWCENRTSFGSQFMRRIMHEFVNRWLQKRLASVCTFASCEWLMEAFQTLMLHFISLYSRLVAKIKGDLNFDGKRIHPFSQPRR